jgi:hypothetical protein
MSNRDTISQLIKAYSGQRKMVVIPMLYIQLLGDLNRAALLNQIIFWSDNSSNPDGWFYKSYEDWQEELGLSQYQVSRAIKGDKRNLQGDELTLQAVGVEVKRKRIKTGAVVNHYRVNMDILTDLIINNVHNHRLSTKSTIDHTEITTEKKDSMTAQNAATGPAPQNPKTEVVNWSDVKEYFHSDTGTWDDGYVYIDRGGHIPGLKKSDWGNPFTMRPEGTDNTTDERERVVEQYRAWLNDPRRCKLYNRIFTDLRGKKLVCHCAPDRCHGDVLADIANEPQAKPYTRWFIGVFDAFGFFLEDNGQAQLILRGMNPTVKLDPPLRDADELLALAEWRRKTNAPPVVLGPELVEAVNAWRTAELYAPKAPPTVEPESTVPSKKPRPRDLIFDAIAEGSFGIRNGQIEQEDKTPGGRIGKIKKWLLSHKPDVTTADIQRFYVWYDSEIEASRPRDVGKFSEHWLAWESNQTPDTPATTYYTASEALPVSTPEEMAEKRRIIAEALKKRGEES